MRAIALCLLGMLGGCAFSPVGTVKLNSAAEVCAPTCMQYGLTLSGYGQPTVITAVPPSPMVIANTPSGGVVAQ